MGDSGVPYLGHTLPMLYSTLEWSRDRYERYGSVSWMNFLGIRAIHAVGADAMADVLFNRDRSFSNAEAWGYFLNPFFQRGVMLLDFEEHVRHRRILQQAFTRPRLADYLAVMNVTIDRTIARWRMTPNFPLYPHVKQLTLNIATEVFIGAGLGSQSSRIDEAFVAAVHAPLAIMRADVPGGAYSRGLRGRKTLETYFRELIPGKRRGNGTDLLSVLCHAEDDGRRLTDDDVVNHMIFVMMAAHDTSTATMAMMAYLLGKHPQWQAKARAQSLALRKSDLDYHDIDQLTVLDAVMKETLRLYPPVAAHWRYTLQDTQIDGHYIPAHSRVFVNSFGSHRLQNWWPNPDQFDPDRFSDTRREDKTHRAAWAPFGAGAHKCIGMHFGGMEIKTVMHKLLLKYGWSVDGHRQLPIKMTTGPIPADGLPLRIFPLSA